MVVALRGAAEEGRLTLEELADRVERALAATTHGDLAPLTADLPAAVAETAPRRRGTRLIVSAIGGGDRKGRWRVGRRLTIVCGIGGTDLDLRHALVEDAETEITVVSIIGGSDIVVPDGVEVELGGFSLIGGNALKGGGGPPPPPARRSSAYGRSR